MTDSRRDQSKRGSKKPYRKDSEERRYVELLYDVKRDKSDLEREIVAMNERRTARKEKAKYLLNQIDMLKETLTSLRKNKEVSIRRLKSEYERLREAKRLSIEEDAREQKRDEVMVRQQRASVSSVPVYDRKIYR